MIEKTLNLQGLIPLFSQDDFEGTLDIIRNLYEGGARIVEYMNRTSNSLETFERVKRVCKIKFSDLILGVGTIKNVNDCLKFLSVDADFIVCPGVNVDIIKLCINRERVCIPGCMTPSEIINTGSLGIKIIKIFPANILQVGFIKVIKPIFPNMLWIPTGKIGTSEQELEKWFVAGVNAVGIGGQLVKRDWIRDQNYFKVQELTKQTLETIRNIKIRICQ